MYQGAKDKIKSVATTVIGSVERTEEAASNQSAKAIAIAKHQSEAFSEGVEDLVRKAEAAIGKKSESTQPEATTTPGEPTSPADTSSEASSEDVDTAKKADIYDAPLPVGFEPPPGYKRPAPPKPKPAPVPEVAAKSTPVPLPPLPLVAPSVQEFGASEPVISQLASVIDNLASYLNTNPAAAEKANDILDSAKTDLTQLAKRIEEVKEEERTKLEAALDEQTREYSLKLMELEMDI